MCEPTDGGACGCSTTTTTRPAPTRRTCATEGCDRIASGGALNCRTCRAEAPIRRELAQREAAHRREVQAYREALGTVKRTLFEATGAEALNATHAARLAAKDIASKEAAIEVLDRKCGILRMDRDARAKHINQGEADAIGQMLGCEPVGRSMMWAAGGLRQALDECRRAHDAIDGLHTLALSERDDWKRVAEKNADERREARTEVATIRTRLHIMYAVAVLLGVASVVGGVL